MNNVPLIDLAGGRRSDLVKAVGEASERLGIFFVKPAGKIQAITPAYTEVRKFANLPTEVKQSYDGKKFNYQVGWTPSLTEVGLACRRVERKPNPVEEKPDIKECFFMRTQLPDGHPLKTLDPTNYADNIWPDEVPDLQPTMTELFDTLFSCGSAVLDLLNEYLGYPRGHLVQAVQESPTSMRGIHYPPIPPELKDKVKWACQHTDINFITILPASTRSGLWVKRLDGIWIPGAPPEDCVIVQIGDMLQWHTAGRLKSTVHEVRAPEEPISEGRISAALFIHPYSSFVLNPNGAGPRFRPRTAKEFLNQRLNAINLS